MSTKLWRLLPEDRERAGKIREKAGVSALAGRVLAARGLSPETVCGLVGEAADPLHDPFLLKDMDRAAVCVSRAIEEGKFIAVYGDYDCDGVAASAMVMSYLESVGARALYYIPDREREGYGLNRGAIDELKRLGVELILTVDNGVSAIDEVAYAASLGIETVITDHHMPREILPGAAAVVDPHREDCGYPFPDLCGAGVAFKLLCALEGERGYGLLEQYADFLAIGTVADVVPLTGENRYFVRRGVEQLRDSIRPGIRELIAAAGVERERFSAESIAFGLAPRINAAGRLDTADWAVMLLLTESETEAKELAERLEGFNRQRRALEKKISDDVAAAMDSDPALSVRRVLVLSGEGWHAGVAGIVCSRVVERYGKPCILIARNGEEAKGSGRSVEGFSLIEAVGACREKLTRYGGHPMAAGMSLRSEDIGWFAEAMEAYAAAHYPVMPPQRLSIDCEVAPGEMNPAEIEALSALEPFGAGNEYPAFCIMGARLDRIVPMGEGKHVRLSCSKNGVSFQTVWFFMTREALPVQEGDLIDAAFTASVNVWQNEARVSLKMLGVRLCGFDYERFYREEQRYEQYRRGEMGQAGLAPSRDEVAVVYRYFKKLRCISYQPEVLYQRMNPRTDYLKYRIILEVLFELSLLVIHEDGTAAVNLQSPKVDLESSKIIRSLTNEYAGQT